MMKKNGFTLAEVLITLAIIGVVATMTLPALLTNTGEQQYKTALKKGISTLTDISQMNQAIDGYDYSGLSSDTSFGDSDAADPEKQTLFAMMANRGNIDFQKSADTATSGTNYSHTPDGGNAPNRIIYFRDGSAILYNQTDSVATDDNAARLEDGLPKGFPIIFDTNGSKGPNQLSNCIAAGAGGIDETQFDDDFQIETGTDVGDDCKDKSQRVIKDQFQVQLRGGFAQPSGAAAVWAFNN